MGALFTSCSKWIDTEKCLGNSWSEQNINSLERKLQAMEQRMTVLEQRVNTTEEANQRLHNKWNGMDEKIHQCEQLQNGNNQIWLTRLRAIDQRIENMSFDHCERLDDDIIVIEER